MSKKIVLLILILASVFSSAFVSCSEKETAGKTAGSSAASAVTSDTTSERYKLGVPESDFKGQQFNVLTTVHAKYEFGTGEQTGDVVDDAVYTRNSAVEDLLNIKFNFIIKPGHWDDRAAFNDLIKGSVLAGDGAFNLVNGVTVCVLPTASDGLFLNANDVKYINFDNPWWVSGMNATLAINGRLYGFIGDANLSLYKDMSVFYFNKSVLSQFRLDDPYGYVRDGKWTVDRMESMVKAVSKDLDGDGAITYEKDLIGYYAQAVSNRALLTAVKATVFDLDKNGTPYYAGLSDRLLLAYSKLYPFFSAEPNVFVVATDDHTGLSKAFIEDRSLFFVDFLYATEYLRDMSSDFGIIPYPKLDEDQDGYRIQLGTSTSMFFIPITTPDPDLAGMVCEALCYESRKEVVPVYYEVALKEKYTRDNDVKEMLDIIKSSAQMNFNYAYSTCFTTFPSTIFQFMNKGSDIKDIASFFAGKESAWKSELQKLLDAYSK